MKPISVYICIPICLCIFRLLSLSLCIIYYCYYYYSFHSCSVEVEIVILFYILGIFRCWICVYDFLLWLIVFFATSVLIADTSFHTHIYLRIQLYKCTSIFIVVSQSVCKGKKTNTIHTVIVYECSWPSPVILFSILPFEGNACMTLCIRRTSIPIAI